MNLVSTGIEWKRCFVSKKDGKISPVKYKLYSFSVS